MKSSIRLLAVAVAATALLLSGTAGSAQARSTMPPGWCIGIPSADGTCTY